MNQAAGGVKGGVFEFYPVGIRSGSWGVGWGWGVGWSCGWGGSVGGICTRAPGAVGAKIVGDAGVAAVNAVAVYRFCPRITTNVASWGIVGAVGWDSGGATARSVFITVCGCNTGGTIASAWFYTAGLISSFAVLFYSGVFCRV